MTEQDMIRMERKTRRLITDMEEQGVSRYQIKQLEHQLKKQAFSLVQDEINQEKQELAARRRSLSLW